MVYDEVSKGGTCDVGWESQVDPRAGRDAIHADSEVRGAYRFYGEGGFDGARVVVGAERGDGIEAALRMRIRGTDTAHGEELAEHEEDEHIMEDIIGPKHKDAVSDSSAVVDTAAESVSECSICESEDDGAETARGDGDGARLSDGARPADASHGYCARMPRRFQTTPM